jgi:hypothetical protein
MTTKMRSCVNAAVTLSPSFTPSCSGPLQREASQLSAVDPATSEVPPIVYQVLRSRGQPLGARTRAFFEPRFGHDFSQVRVHTDERDVESARDTDALAYIVGQDIVFGADRGSVASFKAPVTRANHTHRREFASRKSKKRSLPNRAVKELRTTVAPEPVALGLAACISCERRVKI